LPDIQKVLGSLGYRLKIEKLSAWGLCWSSIFSRVEWFRPFILSW
jgi:hypothetical protein